MKFGLDLTREKKTFECNIKIHVYSTRAGQTIPKGQLFCQNHNLSYPFAHSNKDFPII